jgi:hypothetical protein
MKNISFLLIVLLTGCSINSNNLVGKWQFEDFYHFQDSMNTIQKEDKVFWSHYKMYFDRDKNYHTEGLFSEAGTWDFNEKNNTITLINKTGSEETFHIVELNNQKLIINYPEYEGQGFIFKKISSK